MRVPPALSAALGPAMGPWALRALALTLRIRREENTVRPLWAEGRAAIYIVWHGRLLLLPHVYRGWRLRVLVSRSRDGDMIARFVRRFRLEAVRGSSSRGGAEALRHLARSLQDGWSVCVIPDGPTGPREMLKPGVVALARLSGAPIVPLAVGSSADWRLRSWDEFRIPKPFARCLIRFGEPIEVGRRADRAADEACRKEVEAALRALTWSVDEEVHA